jgi:hypothetical protein
MEDGSNSPGNLVKHGGSERFAFACAIVGKGFRCKRIELAVIDIYGKGAVPVLCVKLFEPGAKLPEFRFRKSGNLRFYPLE